MVRGPVSKGKDFGEGILFFLCERKGKFRKNEQEENVPLGKTVAHGFACLILRDGGHRSLFKRSSDCVGLNLRNRGGFVESEEFCHGFSSWYKYTTWGGIIEEVASCWLLVARLVARARVSPGKAMTFAMRVR